VLGEQNLDTDTGGTHAYVFKYEEWKATRFPDPPAADPAPTAAADADPAPEQ